MATTLDLISMIKILGSFPTTDDLFSQADYLAILNKEMQSQVTPMFQSLRGEYNLAYFDIPITANVDTYRIPRRAIGSKLRNIQIITGTAVSELPRFFEEDRRSITDGQSGYYLKSQQIVIQPKPTITRDTLRLAYFRRPSDFVLPTSCAQIVAIGATTVTVSSVPTTFGASVLVDFVQVLSPYDALAIDLPIVSIAGMIITFTTIPADLAIGDYVCIGGETCTPGMPQEVVPFLTQCALVTMLTSKKDSSAPLEITRMKQMRDNIVDLMSPRVASSDVKLVTRNSLLNYRR